MGIRAGSHRQPSVGLLAKLSRSVSLDTNGRFAPRFSVSALALSSPRQGFVNARVSSRREERYSRKLPTLRSSRGNSRKRRSSVLETSGRAEEERRARLEGEKAVKEIGLEAAAAGSANSDNRVPVLGSTQFFSSSGRVPSILDYPDKKRERKGRERGGGQERRGDQPRGRGRRRPRCMSWWYRAK